jgi:hypothetical protein
MEMMTFEEFKTGSLERPSDFGYHGDKALCEPGGWGFTPFAINRDSDVMANCNWIAIKRRLFEDDGQWLNKEEGDEEEQADDIDAFEDLKEDAPYDILNCGHWAVGWTRQILVDHSDENALRQCYSLYQAMQDEPILDDELFYEMEYADQLLTLTNCYDCTAEEADWVMFGIGEEGKDFESQNDDDIEWLVNHYAYPVPTDGRAVENKWYTDEKPKADHAVVVIHKKHVRISFSDNRTAGFPMKDDWRGPALSFAGRWAKTVEVIEA